MLFQNLVITPFSTHSCRLHHLHFDSMIAATRPHDYRFVGERTLEATRARYVRTLRDEASFPDYSADARA